MWARRHTRARLRSIQDDREILLELGVPGDRLLSSAYAVSGGRLISGAGSIVTLLGVSTVPVARLAGRALSLPFVDGVTEVAYRWVARNRAAISQRLGLARCRR